MEGDREVEGPETSWRTRGAGGWYWTFLSNTDVGRRVPVEEEDAVSEVSEAELREWVEEQGAGAEGKEELASCNVPNRADSGRETWIKSEPP